MQTKLLRCNILHCTIRKYPNNERGYPMELKDKVIVVTGGGRGVGRAMALELADKGAKLALVVLNQDDLEQTAGLWMEKGVEARTYTGNVGVEDEVEKLFTDSVRDF